MWSKLSEVDPIALADTRLTLHWSAQLIGAVGFAFADPAPDDSHSNFLWDTANRRFLGRPLPGGTRVFIELHEFEAGIVDSEDVEHRRFPLVGKTLTEAYGELESGLSILQFSGTTLRTPSYDLPAHPVQSGAAFDEPNFDHLKAFRAWYGAAYDALHSIAAQHEGASEVRGWPHHFDLATLIGLDENAHHEEARSVGVGFSPGDAETAEPYFYVTPWPAPASDQLTKLNVGHWNTEGWTGAVLTATELRSESDPESSVSEFLNTALSASFDALE